MNDDNVMRQAYRQLTNDEQVSMIHVKDLGKQLHDYIKSLGTSRELSIAATKTEEAVMWAVKHLTR